MMNSSTKSDLDSGLEVARLSAPHIPRPPNPNPNPPQHWGVSSAVRWSVAQVFSKRAHLIKRDVEAMGHGVMEPIYVKRRIVGKEKQVREYKLLPGYLFFETTDDWGDVSAVEGVIRVLSGGLRVSETEAHRLTLPLMLGDYNEVEAPKPAVTEPRRRGRRKPRPGRRIRQARVARILSAGAG